MGLMNPWFLAAATAMAVPVFLHLFHRRKAVRISFPALRYLERTERDHAREIRVRQLLLLALRLAALGLLVFAGARPVLFGPSSAHPPTAVVIVLDNGAGSARVSGEERMLDVWKRLAERTLARATPDDRFWVVRAGEPWTPATPLGAEAARAAVRDTEVSAARGDLTGALERGAALLRTSGFEHGEIHLLSALPRAGFDLDERQPADDVAVIVWASGAPPPNRGVAEALVGGGVAPLAGEPSEIQVRLSDLRPAPVRAEADPDEGPTEADPVGVRLVLDGQIRSAASALPGSELVFEVPAATGGWITGWVEADPDALSLDDRRYFAYRVRTPPVVAVQGAPGSFAEEALAVLVDAGRIVRGPPAAADVLFSVGGEGLDALPPGRAAVVVPPEDPTRLPALLRSLDGAGVAWRYTARGRLGGTELEGASLPPGLDGVRFEGWYGLERTDERFAEEGRVLAEAGADPWAVETLTPSGSRILLVASPLDLASSNLPVSAGFVRFLDWIVGEWAGAGGSTADRVAGEPLPAPRGATHVVTPAGDTVAIDGTRQLASTRAAGHYTFFGDEGTVAVLAVNPPPSESDPTPLGAPDYERALGRDVTVVSELDGWSDAVFRTRRGPEFTWPLVLVAALLLVLESLVAAAGGTAPADPSRSSRPREPVPHGAP